MKVRQKVRSKQMPTTDSSESYFDDWRFGLNESRRVVRMTVVEAAICNRLGISIEDYAKGLLAGKTK